MPIFSIDKEKIFWRTVEGQVIILNVDTGYYYNLDEIGTLVWNMAFDNKTADQIIAEILNNYETDERSARRDVRALLMEMQNEKLITITQEKPI